MIEMNGIIIQADYFKYVKGTIKTIGKEVTSKK